MHKIVNLTQEIIGIVGGELGYVIDEYSVMSGDNTKIERNAKENE